MSGIVKNIHEKAWHGGLTPVILAPRRLRQGCLKFKAILCYRDTVSKRKKIPLS